MNNHCKKKKIFVESLFNSDSVSTYKNAGLSIHILASIFNFRHTGNRMFAILWWQYCEFSNLIQKKTDDSTFLTYVAILKLGEYISFRLVIHTWL